MELSCPIHAASDHNIQSTSSCDSPTLSHEKAVIISSSEHSLQYNPSGKQSRRVSVASLVRARVSSSRNAVANRSTRRRSSLPDVKPAARCPATLHIDTRKTPEALGPNQPVPLGRFWCDTADHRLRSPTDDVVSCLKGDIALRLPQATSLSKSPVSCLEERFHFRQSGFLSLDGQLRMRCFRDKFSYRLRARTSCKSSSILKFGTSTTFVYHHVPPLRDMLSNSRDPRHIIPRNMLPHPAMLMAAAAAPNLFQRPFTYLQTLYIARAVDSDAWMSAVLDPLTTLEGAQLEWVTRANAFGVDQVPCFAELSDIKSVDPAYDSGVQLTSDVMAREAHPANEPHAPERKEIHCVSGASYKAVSEPTLACDDAAHINARRNVVRVIAARGVVGSAGAITTEGRLQLSDAVHMIRRRVHFAKTLVTGVAVIRSQNRGRRARSGTPAKATTLKVINGECADEMIAAGVHDTVPSGSRPSFRGVMGSLESFVPGTAFKSINSLLNGHTAPGVVNIEDSITAYVDLNGLAQQPHKRIWTVQSAVLRNTSPDLEQGHIPACEHIKLTGRQHKFKFWRSSRVA